MTVAVSGTPRRGATPDASVPVAVIPVGADPLTVAWCAACREEAEFVAPVGLADAGPDELACLQCGWAVLVVPDPGAAPVRAA